MVSWPAQFIFNVSGTASPPPPNIIAVVANGDHYNAKYEEMTIHKLFNEAETSFQ